MRQSETLCTGERAAAPQLADRTLPVATHSAAQHQKPFGWWEPSLILEIILISDFNVLQYQIRITFSLHDCFFLSLITES